MEKYLLFGFMPIRISSSGTWTADVSDQEAGEGCLNCLANTFARSVLKFVGGVEHVFNVTIPVVITPAEEPIGSPG